MFIDPLYLLFALPGLLLALAASLYTKSTFSRYSQVSVSSGVSGAQAAEKLLRNAGLSHVRIEEGHGFLSDHYDPRDQTLRLSPAVYSGRSLSSVGVACHEAGHAIQDATNYTALRMRTTLVPVASTGGPIAYGLILLGFLFQSQALMIVGIVFFCFSVLFALVTLPVEWDASSRAKQLMVSAGIVRPGAEAQGAGAVLNAAFLTYVAAAVNALLILLYYLMRAGLLGGRRN